jgi:hypothetical protein
LLPAAWVGATSGDDAGAPEGDAVDGVDEDDADDGVAALADWPDGPEGSEALREPEVVALPTDVVEPCDADVALLVLLEQEAVRATAQTAPATASADIRFMRPTFPGDYVK